MGSETRILHARAGHRIQPPTWQPKAKRNVTTTDSQVVQGLKSFGMACNRRMLLDGREVIVAQIDVPSGKVWIKGKGRKKLSVNPRRLQFHPEDAIDQS